MPLLLSLIARALARLVASSADDGSKDIEILALRLKGAFIQIHRWPGVSQA